MKTIKPREIVILKVALVGIGLFAGDRFLWSPLSASWRRLDQKIATKRVQVAVERKALANPEKIKKEYTALVSGHPEGLLREIESLAQRSHIKISDLKPQDGSVQVVIESAWEPMSRFLAEVQRSPHLLRIEKAAVQRKGDFTALLTGQFEIRELRGIP